MDVQKRLKLEEIYKTLPTEEIAEMLSVDKSEYEQGVYDIVTEAAKKRNILPKPKDTHKDTQYFKRCLGTKIYGFSLLLFQILFLGNFVWRCIRHYHNASLILTPHLPERIFGWILPFYFIPLGYAIAFLITSAGILCFKNWAYYCMKFFSLLWIGFFLYYAFWHIIYLFRLGVSMWIMPTNIGLFIMREWDMHFFFLYLLSAIYYFNKEELNDKYTKIRDSIYCFINRESSNSRK